MTKLSRHFKIVSVFGITVNVYIYIFIVCNAHYDAAACETGIRVKLVEEYGRFHLMLLHSFSGHTIGKRNI